MPWVPPLKGVSLGTRPHVVRRALPPDFIFHYFHNMKRQICQSPLALFFDKDIKPFEEYPTIQHLRSLHGFSRSSQISTQGIPNKEDPPQGISARGSLQGPPGGIPALPKPYSKFRNYLSLRFTFRPWILQPGNNLKWLFPKENITKCSQIQ